MTEAERIALTLRNTAFGRVVCSSGDVATVEAGDAYPIVSIVDAAKALADHCPGNSVEATVTHRMHMLEAVRLLAMAMEPLVKQLADEHVTLYNIWAPDWTDLVIDLQFLKELDVANWLNRETDREREHRAEHGEPYGSYREGDE